MNDVATQSQFFTTLVSTLEQSKNALPKDLNIERFAWNSDALVRGNESLYKFGQTYGSAQIIMGLMRGAYLGLDALNQEMYLVPYGSTLQFMPGYKGMVKMVLKYSRRPVANIYAKELHEGDEYEESIEDGIIKPKPVLKFSNRDKPIIGVFAVCRFKDGEVLTEVMTKKEIDKCKAQSRAKNSPAWSNFWGEMAKKTVIRRLCKSITLDMDAETKAAFEAGTEIETDAKELAAKDISENQNSQDFVIDGEMTELDSQMTEVGNGFEQ